MVTGAENRLLESVTVKVTVPAYINYPPSWSSLNDLKVLSWSTLTGGWSIPSAISNQMPARSAVYKNNGLTPIFGYLPKRPQKQIISPVNPTLTKNYFSHTLP